MNESTCILRNIVEVTSVKLGSLGVKNVFANSSLIGIKPLRSLASFSISQSRARDKLKMIFQEESNNRISNYKT